MDWEAIAAKMAAAVYDCCGCNVFRDLTDEEADALERAIAANR